MNGVDPQAGCGGGIDFGPAHARFGPTPDQHRFPFLRKRRFLREFEGSRSMAPQLFKERRSVSKRDCVVRIPNQNQTLTQMKTRKFLHSDPSSLWLITCCAAGLFVLVGNHAQASIAYGTISNFDTVNDTSNVCHGFEIELDDCRSQDITRSRTGTPATGWLLLAVAFRDLRWNLPA